MNSNLATVGEKITKFGSMSLLKVRKYSPEILTVLGVAGVISATVMACKATLKAPQIMEKHRENIDGIERLSAQKYADYTEKDAQKDLVLTYFETGKSFVKIYWPAATVGAVSLAALLGAQGILKKRNVALLAAYKVIDEAFSEYRGRVIEELGKEQDFHFRHGTKFEKIVISEEVDPETGKVKKIKKEVQTLPNGNVPSLYARMFAEQVYDPETGGWEGSNQWSPHFEYNLSTLKIKNSWANDHLRARGYLFLNDVYDELGFPRTKAGQLVGWLWNGDGDNYVSFGPEMDAFLEGRAGYMDFKASNAILLDFNVDGQIIDLI